MTGSMFMDLRALYGRSDLVRALKEHALPPLSEDQGFLVRMAQNMTNFLPPLGWFGRSSWRSPARTGAGSTSRRRASSPSPTA